MDDKIIQIIPAPKNLFAVYEDTENEGIHHYSEIICFGLSDQGEIYAMDMDNTGFIDKAESADNFIGIQRRR